jgi:hypothetical protein
MLATHQNLNLGCAIAFGCVEQVSRHLVHWGILVEPRADLACTGSRVAPVLEEISYNAEESHKLHASGLHARVGDVLDERRCSPGRFHVSLDAIAFCSER